MKFPLSPRQGGLATVALLAVLTVSAFTAVQTPGRAHAATGAISQSSSGLVASDSLTTGSTSGWAFAGDAASESGAKFSYSENSTGLHIGVQSGADATYAGYFAESPDTTAQLFSAVVTIGPSSVPDDTFNNGIYVQTSNNDFIDFVDCAGVVTTSGYYWTVTQSYGIVVGSQMTSTLYESPMDALPLTETCTIITNGSNFLEVYLGGNVVVDRDNLTLNMPSPFNAYLEPETSTATLMLTGTFTDYYATAGQGVTVTNAPAGGTAELVGSSNNVLASAPIASNGTATMLIGQYALPLSAVLEVLYSNGTLAASTASPISVWGGDVYQVSSTSTTTSTTTTSSTTAKASSTTSSTTTSSSSGTSGITLNGAASTSGSASIPMFQVTLPRFNPGGGSDRLLVVGVAADDYSVSSITFGNLSLTQAGGTSSFYYSDTELWYLDGTPPGYPSVPTNIVVTMSGPTSVVVGAYAFSGVDQGTPIATWATNYGSGGSPAISLTTRYAGSWILDQPSVIGSSLTAPTCTQEWNADVSGAVTGASSYLATSTPGEYSCSWTPGPPGAPWDDMAVEIHPTTTSQGITVYASRIAASYWDPCFATECSAGTGPGATMYFALYNSAGALIASGFSDEHGYTFAGLTPGTTYYLDAESCDMCHGAPHDVVFEYWGSGSTAVPLAVTVGSTVDAWYSCTLECQDG